MLSAKDIPEAIQWHEGMLLSPQHFQELATRQEVLLQYSAAAMAPYYWGVRRFEYDRTLLVGGKLRIVELEAVMPDGSVVLQEPQWERGLEIDLEPHKEALTQPQGEPDRGGTVHVVLPIRKSGFVKGDLARYESVDGEPVPDVNTGEGQIQIPRLRPRANLLCTEEPPSKYVSLPIARIRYEDESFRMANYTPPSPTVVPGSPLHRLCKDLAERIREKAVSLSERSHASAGVLTGGASVSGARHAVHCLVAGLPTFETVLSTPGAHPYTLYLALCGLVGHLASLGRGLVPPVMPAYDHCDLLAIFEQARRYTDQMIRDGIPESHTAYPMKLDADTFSIFLEEDWARRQVIAELRPRTGVPMDDLIRWGEQCIIGSQSTLSSLMSKRVRGAPRQQIDHEGDLFPLPGAVMFNIGLDPDALKPNEVMQIRNREESLLASQPAEIVLYVRNPS